MKEELKLVTLNEEYCNYLRKYDERVQSNYQEKRNRPYIGILFELNNLKYFAPLSSPKSKHITMHNTLDFMKLDNGYLGAINFNNMIPVKENFITYIELDNDKINKKYNKLLKEQIYYINRNKRIIKNKAKRLYISYTKGFLKENIYKRCCNFKLLEEKCLEYNKVKETS